ncbi:MAG TPA: ABC transporter permease [Feifaniaceae bacterium]|nr:ABC transporter permease [Feifaniaceae bacterium]
MTQPVLNTKPAAGRKRTFDFMRYFSVVAVILLVGVFTILDHNFVNRANLTNLLSDTAPLMIMACGATMVLLLGSVDLSIGSTCSVVNVLMVKILSETFRQTNNLFLSTVCAFGASLAFGAAAGFMLGFIHVRLKIPSFIASLGFMSVWKSTALLISEAPVSIPKALWPSINWAKISFGVLGFPLVLAGVVILVFFVLQSKTSFGKALYAIGGNERAARMAGIRIDRCKILAFVLSGLCSALGSIFLAAKLKSSAPTVGDPFTLLVIASVALGGTALSGGKGSVLGTVLGVFIVSIIRNGLNFAGVDVFWQNIVFGIVVIAAVAITVDRTGRSIVVK